MNAPISRFFIFLGTFPTCHDFGPVTEESEIVPLVVGFSGGQIQLVDPIRKELSKLFNEEVSFKDIFFPDILTHTVCTWI